MSTTTERELILSGADAWLAVSTEYPRIAALGETEEQARANLDARRQWWATLPDIDETDSQDDE